MKAIRQTVQDYLYVAQKLEDEKAANPYYDREEIEFREYMAILEFPIQLISRFKKRDYWGVDFERGKSNS